MLLKHILEINFYVDWNVCLNINIDKQLIFSLGLTSVFASPSKRIHYEDNEYA